MIKSSFYLLIVILLFQNCTSDSQKPIKEGDDANDNQIQYYIDNLSSISNNDSLLSLAKVYENTLSHKLSDEEKSAYYSKLGVILYQHSFLAKADSSFYKAQIAFSNLGDSSSVSHMRMNRAAMNEMEGNFERAVVIYHEVIEYFKRTNDSAQLANSYSNLGVAYQTMELPENSLEYHKKALTLRKAIFDTINIAYSYNNIGVVFMEDFDNVDSALYYYKKAYIIFKDKNALYESSTVSNNIGHIYLNLKEFEKVDEYFAYSYKVYDSLNMEQGRAEILRSYGQLYFAQGNDDMAVKSLISSLEINEIAGNQKEILEINRILSKIHIADGDFVKAIRTMQIVNKLSDSILNIDKQKAIADIETKYQVKEKNKTIEVLKLEEELHIKQIRNQTIFIVLLSVIFGLIILVLVYISRQNRLQAKHLRLELHNYLLRIDEMQSEIMKKGSKQFNNDKLKEFDLTSREIEVLNLISQGFKNSEIANSLFVSQNTIKTHIKNIYVKLDVKNRVEALRRVDTV